MLPIFQQYIDSKAEASAEGDFVKPYLVALGLSLVISWILTPAVKKLAFHLGAVDRPNARKVHHRIMPRMAVLPFLLAL